MVKALIRRVQPKHGFAHFLHLSLVAVIPPLAYIFVRLEFFAVAAVVVLLSKWRMFAVQPRYWLAHIRTNAVDIAVSLSLLSFMIVANDSMRIQLLWLLAFELWVLYIKPGASTMLVSVQALLAQFLGSVALFLTFETAPFWVYIVLIAALSYFSARHFFAAYEETHGVQYSWLWALFAASLTWILGHWLLFFGPIAQPALLLAIAGYGIGGLYYLHEHDKLTLLVRRQIIFVTLAIIVVVLAFSNWGDNIIK